MVDKFQGLYTLQTNENFDEYMKKIGVNFALRKLALATNNNIEFVVNGDDVEMKTTSTVRNSQTKFKMNDEFEETTMDGRKCKTTFTVEDGKLYQRQIATKENEKNSEIIRELDDKGNMVVWCICDDVKAKRYYAKQ